jgi:FlaA1/EpsC-like NDP-sugar epimerase
MGHPVRIQYLAEQMIRLSGHLPGEDIPIVYTGLRPGEKLAEELFHKQEAYLSTGREKIRRARHRKLDARSTGQLFAGLQEAVRDFDEAAIDAALRGLLPEYGADPQDTAVGPVVNLNQARGKLRSSTSTKPGAS